MVIDAARFIQPGVTENRICECAPSQRGRVGEIFEAKKFSGGTPAARRRLAARLPQSQRVDDLESHRYSTFFIFIFFYA